MVAAKKPARPRPKKVAVTRTAAKKPGSKAKTSEPPPAGDAPKASEYAVGDRVSHPMFGAGTVAAIDADRLTIKFADGVTKHIVDSYVKPRKD